MRRFARLNGGEIPAYAGMAEQLYRRPFSIGEGHGAGVGSRFRGNDGKGSRFRFRGNDEAPGGKGDGARCAPEWIPAYAGMTVRWE